MTKTTNKHGRSWGYRGREAERGVVRLTRHTVSVLTGKKQEPRDIYFTAPPVRELADMSQEDIAEIYRHHGIPR